VSSSVDASGSILATGGASSPTSAGRPTVVEDENVAVMKVGTICTRYDPIENDTQAALSKIFLFYVADERDAGKPAPSIHYFQYPDIYMTNIVVGRSLGINLLV
jgi:hypothetical protein